MPDQACSASPENRRYPPVMDACRDLRYQRIYGVPYQVNDITRGKIQLDALSDGFVVKIQFDTVKDDVRIIKLIQYIFNDLHMWYCTSYICVYMNDYVWSFDMHPLFIDPDLEERTSCSDSYRLDFRVVIEGILSKLTAESGLLEASKRRLVRKHVVRVHPDSTGFESSRNSDRGVEVCGVYCSSKAWISMIRKLSRYYHRMSLAGNKWETYRKGYHSPSSRHQPHP